MAKYNVVRDAETSNHSNASGGRQRMNTYYVYQYLRAKDSDIAMAGTPYYIGKGKGKRAWRKGQSERIQPPSDPNNVVIVAENLTESQAFDLEMLLISKWGRIDKETGILRNRADGGPGAPGAIRTEEHKQKVGKANKNRAHHSPSPEAIKKRADANRGKKRTAEFCKLLSEINKGRKRGPISEEIKQKISNSLSGRAKPPRTADHAQKLRNALKGRKLTPEQRAIRKTPVRSPMSEETKAKIGKANKGKLAGRKRSRDRIDPELAERTSYLNPVEDSMESNCSNSAFNLSHSAL